MVGWLRLRRVQYIFRMAVARRAAGHDIGKLLDWAAAEVARWGHPWLRLDVHRQNKELREYYERHGFIKVAEVTAPDLSVPGRTRGSGTLMQRPTPPNVIEIKTEACSVLTTALSRPASAGGRWGSGSGE
ncbi:MAG: GNAT family N-acetyltransferase [Pseudonocardiaceae bacterium]